MGVHRKLQKHDKNLRVTQSLAQQSTADIAIVNDTTLRHMHLTITN